MMLFLRLVLALAFLAIALTFDNNWPGLGIRLYTDLSIEMLLLLAVGLAHVTRAGNTIARNRRLNLWAALLTVLIVLHYLDVTVQGLFGRPLNLFWDGRHVPRVLVMAATNSASWQVVAALLAVSAALSLLYAMSRAALGTVFAFAQTRLKPAMVSASLGLVAILASAFGVLGPIPYRDHVLTPVTYTFGKQLLMLAATFTPGASDRLLSAGPSFDGGLAALDGADVMIVFAESYGVSTFENRGFATALEPARLNLQAAVSATGRFAASALVRSPTFGGASWLAHAELLAGIDMREPDHHALLLASRRATLVRHFKTHGYRSVALMPGLHSEWPEGAFYEFDRIYDAQSLGYTGPEFGFWRIPDQFSIGRLHQLELASGDGVPRLVVFPTITSHLPFDPVPPVVADWSFAGKDGTPARFAQQIDSPAVRESLGRTPDWQHLGEPYTRAIDYTLRWLAGYLHALAPRPMVLIILGDHQPAATVVGRDTDWAVPVHVISDSKALIDSFVASGFVHGWVPERPELGPMRALTPLLLQRFDGCPATGSAHRCPQSANPQAAPIPARPSSAPNTNAAPPTDTVRQ